MNMRLIAIDMDGTLLRSDLSISVADCNALRRAASEGIQVIICSGRVCRSAESFSRPLGLRHPIVACNGATAVLHPGGEPLWRHYLEPEYIRSALEVLTREQARFFMYDDAGRVLLPPAQDTPENRIIMRDEAEQNAEAARFLEDWRTEPAEALQCIQKFMVLDNDPDHLLSMRREIESCTRVSMLSSWVTNFEIMPIGINKGVGLRRICHLLGVPTEDVVAIGDNQNDWDMMDIAAYTVVMGNAPKETKARADYITADNNHDGVAHAVNHLLRM